MSGYQLSQLNDKLDFSIFLGLVTIEDCHFLAFGKKTVWRGKFLDNDIFELKSVKFVSLNVISESDSSYEF